MYDDVLMFMYLYLLLLGHLVTPASGMLIKENLSWYNSPSFSLVITYYPSLEQFNVAFWVGF